MNKAVLIGIIVAIVVVGIGIGYSTGVGNQEKIDISEQTEDTSQPRNITIELSDGMVFSEGP